MATSEKVLQQIIADLGSPLDETVLEAITKARQKGNKLVIKPVVLLLEHTNPSIQEAAKNMLFDLKDVSAVDELLDVYHSINNHTTQNILLQSLWQSNVQPAGAVSRLMKIAVGGTLEECIEVYSIVTNIIDVHIPDEEATEAIFIANNHIEKIKNPHQKQLITDMVLFLNQHLEE